MFKPILTGALLMTAATAANAATPEDTLYLDLKDGRVVIEMFPEKAPNHVARIKELAREGYYDGKKFHRVIEGFMVQTGSPTGTGIGGAPGKPDLKQEFNDVSHKRGIASMARTNDPNSANAQFFIMLDDNPGLDGQYTVWGRVTEGMQHVDNIKKGDAFANGLVDEPDTIVKMTVAADATPHAKAANE